MKVARKNVAKSEEEDDEIDRSMLGIAIWRDLS